MERSTDKQTDRPNRVKRNYTASHRQNITLEFFCKIFHTKFNKSTSWIVGNVHEEALEENKKIYVIV